MALINCPYCGESVSDKAEVCVHCGKSLKIKRCKECGAILSDDNKFCTSCGCPVKETPDQSQAPSAAVGSQEQQPASGYQPASGSQEQQPASGSQEQQPASGYQGQQPALGSQESPLTPPMPPKPAPSGPSPKLIAGIVAVVALFICVAAFALKKPGGSTGDSAEQVEEKVEESVQEEEEIEDLTAREVPAEATESAATDDFIAKAEEQLCDDWEFVNVMYINDDGEADQLTASEFKIAGLELPTFVAYSDHTYFSHLIDENDINGTWEAYDESICSQLDDTEYCYKLSDVEDLDIIGIIYTEDVDSRGNASKLQIAYSWDGELQFAYTFVK